MDKSSLNLQLVEESPEDVRVAQLLKYKSVDCKCKKAPVPVEVLDCIIHRNMSQCYVCSFLVSAYEQKQKQKREEISSRPLFGITPNSDTSSSGAGSSSGSEASTPSAVSRKHATLTRIGRASSQKRRSDPFASETDPQQIPAAKKSVMSQNLFGIVRVRKSSDVIAESQPKQESECYGQNEQLIANVESSETEENNSAAQSVETVTGSCRKSVQGNALNNLLTSYASSDSSENDLD